MAASAISQERNIEEAEERVIKELKEINKPFIVLLNCMYPTAGAAQEMAETLSRRHSVPVLPVNCLEVDEEQIREILAKILFEFPVKEIAVDLPRWLATLSGDHWLRTQVFEIIKDTAEKITHIREVSNLVDAVMECEYVDGAQIAKVGLGKGSARVAVNISQDLFYRILAETTGLDICGEQDLMGCMMELAKIQKEYMRVKDALDEVEATGYGIVMPTIEELKAILARKRAKEEAVAYRMKEGTRSRETVSDPQYIEAVQAHLREKLKAKYDAKVGVIGRMSDGQLTQMKRQVRKEEELTEEDVRGYVCQINDFLHHN